MEKYILEFNEVVDEIENFVMNRRSFNDLNTLLKYLQLNFYFRDDVSRITNFEIHRCSVDSDDSVPSLFKPFFG